MKKDEVKVGGLYLARVAGKITTVRVDSIREKIGYGRRGIYYNVTNMATGRRTVFGSAAKFRGPAHPEKVEDEQSSDPTSSIAPTTPDSPPPSLPASVVAPLAARIAAALPPVRREQRAPVAGMVPNEEQEAILEAAMQPGLKVLVIAAGAGTGKTATLKMLEQVLPGRGQYTAFNSSLVNEAREKFRKCAVNTTHSLAFRAVGKRYQHRLPASGGGRRMRSSEIAEVLGIEAVQIEVPGRDEPKTLSAGFLAGQAVAAVRRFCQSADRCIGPEHLRYIDGIDVPLEREGGGTRRGHENNDLVREYLTPYLHFMWQDISMVDGRLPFNHDCYVKLWQLGEGTDRPFIAADYILLDEAQDTAPVFLDIIKQQRHALLIMVGDDNQQIYEWRGAVNAMTAFPGAPRRLLSQSYRFGQAVADVANTILATLEEPTDLVMRGMPGMPSRVAEVAEPRCHLFRTNAGAVGTVMVSVAAGKRPHLIGGGADVVAWCQAAIDLQARRGTTHPDLACFDSWGEVQEYSKTDEGGDLRVMVKLVDTFGAEAIRAALLDMPKEEYADLVVSTAHKSKGREWESVKLGSDFPTANRMNDADRRLLYVAATRAKHTLDISVCPPFCGGEDTFKGEDGKESTRQVSGLKITYTQPMPTEEEQAEWLANRPAPGKAPGSAPEGPGREGDGDRPNPPQPGSGPAGAPSVDGKGSPHSRAGGNPVGGRFIWTRSGDKWCVSGPPDVAVGERVTVTRRDGSTSVVTIRKVVQQSLVRPWIYEV